MHTTEHTTPDTDHRPLGFWLRTAAFALRAQFAGHGPRRGHDRREFAGRAARIDDRIAATVSPEDYAITVRTLEAIAREFGYDEDAAGHGLRPGFGPGFGPRPRHGRGRSRHEHGHGGRAAASAADTAAFERGFEAGFRAATR